MSDKPLKPGSGFVNEFAHLPRSFQRLKRFPPRFATAEQIEAHNKWVDSLDQPAAKERES